MGKVIIKKTPSGGFYFHIFAKNGEKVAVASQVYSTKTSCLNGVESVAKNAKLCIDGNKIEDATLKKPNSCTCPKFEIYLDKAGLYRHRLYATNGEVIAITEEGYKTKTGCIGGMKSIAQNAVEKELIDETK